MKKCFDSPQVSSGLYRLLKPDSADARVQPCRVCHRVRFQMEDDARQVCTTRK